MKIGLTPDERIPVATTVPRGDFDGPAGNSLLRRNIPTGPGGGMRGGIPVMTSVVIPSTHQTPKAPKVSDPTKMARTFMKRVSRLFHDPKATIQRHPGITTGEGFILQGKIGNKAGSWTLESSPNGVVITENTVKPHTGPRKLLRLPIITADRITADRITVGEYREGRFVELRSINVAQNTPMLRKLRDLQGKLKTLHFPAQGSGAELFIQTGISNWATNWKQLAEDAPTWEALAEDNKMPFGPGRVHGSRPTSY